MTRKTRRAMAIAAAVGLGSSAASTWVHVQLLRAPGYESFCDIAATVSCSSAYLSRYGTLLGVPVALAGTLWFALVLLLILAARPAGPREGWAGNVPGYVFLLSTGALALVFYLGWASLFVLRTVCPLCLITSAAVIGLFLVSGAANTVPMSTLPRRAWRDLHSLVSSPAALAVTVFVAAGAVSAVAFFPREVAVEADQSVELAAVSAEQRAEFERWYAGLPRIDLPIARGDEKVQIVKFNDYQCPPCRNTYESYKEVLARYERSHPAAVKMVTKDFPLEPECNVHAPAGRHVAGCEAAVAVRLARQRGQGERMEEWLFANQPSLSPSTVRRAVREVAGVETFEQDYARVLEEVKADVALGGRLEVRSTPTFFINGRRLPGGGLSPQFLDLAIAWELGQR